MMNDQRWIGVVIILHAVGIAGLATPWASLFQALSPVVLLITLYALYALYGKPHWFVVGMAPIAVFGYAIEWVGVETGAIFGSYHYLENLGPRLFGIPPMIGVNWALLTFAAVAAARLFLKKKLLVVGAASVLMVTLDVLMERVATPLGYWAWELAPLPDWQNYAGWLVCSIVTCSWLVRFPSAENNLYPAAVLWIQFVFFAALNLMYGTGTLA